MTCDGSCKSGPPVGGGRYAGGTSAELLERAGGPCGRRAPPAVVTASRSSSSVRGSTPGSGYATAPPSCTPPSQRIQFLFHHRVASFAALPRALECTPLQVVRMRHDMAQCTQGKALCLPAGAQPQQNSGPSASTSAPRNNAKNVASTPALLQPDLVVVVPGTATSAVCPPGQGR